MNSNDRLRLLGSLDLVKQCLATWSVDDTSFSLTAGALTPLSQDFLFAQPSTLNLLLQEDTLPERSTLTFTLRCGTAYTSVVIKTKGVPVPGSLVVDPMEASQ